MKKYSTFRTEEFLADNRFLDWVLAPNEASDEYWKTVFILYPSCEHPADEARKILSALKIKPGKKMPREIHQQIIQHLKYHTDEVKTTKKPANDIMRSWKTYLVAGCLLISCGIGISFLLKQTQTPPQTGYLIIEQADTKKSIKKITNTASEQLLLLLPDSSTAILAPNTQITYNEQAFATDRAIYLSGEAFFEVTSQKENPFRVKTNYLTATVLGTSFWVTAAETLAKSKVSVQSGVVEVRQQTKASPTDKPEEPIYLTADQEIVYAEMPSGQVPKPFMSNTIPPPTFGQHFKSTPMKTVLKTLSDQYHIEISVTDSILEKRTVTASLEEMHLFEKLDLISMAVEATYRIVDGKIVFTQRPHEN